MHHRKRQDGFSLVELAIVLLIIGLIVGGVLRGQDLIRSAQINDTQTTMNQIRTAVNTFQDRFVGFPGDFDRQELISDSFDATDNEYGGDGDGRLDDGDRVGAASNNENVLFWVHLAEAGLLSGINGEEIRDDNLDATTGLRATVGGYYSVARDEPFGHSVRTTNWIMLGTGNSGDNNEAFLDAREVQRLDRRNDDGDPTDGDILAGDGSGDGACVSEGDYDVDNDGECAAAFRL